MNEENAKALAAGVLKIMLQHFAWQSMLMDTVMLIKENNYEAAKQKYLDGFPVDDEHKAAVMSLNPLEFNAYLSGLVHALKESAVLLSALGHEGATSVQ